LVDAGAPTLNLTASGNPTPTAFLKQKLRLLKRLFRSGALDSPAGRREATRFEPFLFALLYMPQFFVLNIPTANDTPIGEYGGITLSQFHVDAFISGEEWSVAATQTRQDRDGWIAPRESGKALALDTPILTANRGWTTHGDLTTQDYVFTELGRQAKVVAVRHWRDRPCYQLTFSDGTQITADAQHEWVVNDRYCVGPKTVTTEAMAAKFLLPTGERRYSIPASAPLEYRDKEFDISPYVLGAWLGDGNSSDGRITVGEQDASALMTQLRAEGENPILRHYASAAAPTVQLGKPHPEHCVRGHAITPGVPCAVCVRSLNASYRGGALVPTRMNEALRARLRHAGLADNKHIPQSYLRGSVAQRLALMQGLMDTDGTVDAKGRCEFSVVNERLARQFHELAVSLGIKPSFHTGRATIAGVDKGERYRVAFSTALPVFRLPRKLERLSDSIQRAGTRQIVDIQPAPRQDTNCIQVDSPNHQYLAGTSLIATHNSTIFFTVLPLWAAAHLHRRFIAAFSDSDDQVQKHLAKFHEQVDHNAALREDFPELCRPMRRANGNAVNDNKNEYTAESGFTFSAHTIDGKVVGLVNYENVRPDMLVLDDIEPSEDKYSVAMKNKGVNRLRDKILYLNEFARVVLVGTVTMAGSIMHDVVQSVLNPGHVPVEPTVQNPHRYGTLVPDWVREQNFRGHYYPALSIDPTTGALQSLWPEKWPVQELRPRLGTNDFMKNMQNNPVGDGDFWEQGDITYGHLAGTTVTLLCIDPAVTATATSDYTGLAVIRYQPGNASYDAEQAAGRHHPPQPAPEEIPPEEAARRRAHRRGRRLPPNPTPADRARFVEGLLYQPYDDPTAGVPFTPTPLHTTTPEGALLPKAQSRCEVAWSNRVKMKPERLRLYVLSILERFPEISIILLETNQGHEFTAEPFKDLPVKLVVKNQTEPKDIRIARLAQYYKALDPRVTHAEHFLHLEEEMYAYPQTAHDDSVDAVATGCHYFLFKDPKSAKKRRPGPSVQHTTYLRRRGDTYDDWKVAA
jgi:hypothetical protein